MAPTNAPLARASLDSSKHPSVNAFLKSLKLHTRTLSALFAQHSTELAVLERLHYLNNNQHRPVLFWQRVIEARRYARRLRSLDVPSLVDCLRRSFYGDVTDASSKWQKGAWTHYPSTPSLKSFLSPLKTCTALLDKTCVRMRAIYQMLTLAMQSGAFLQLVVTLTALVARLAHLSSTIRGVLSTLHAESLLLLAKLHPADAPRHLAPIRPPPPPTTLEEDDMKPIRLPLELSKRPVPDGDLDVSVDLGEAVARTPALTPRPKSRPSSPVQLDYLTLARDATFAPVVGARQPAAAEIARTISESALGPSSRQAVRVKNRSGPLAPPKPYTTAEESKEKKRKKAKKVKLDEIDEIFS